MTIQFNVVGVSNKVVVIMIFYCFWSYLRGVTHAKLVCPLQRSLENMC